MLEHTTKKGRRPKGKGVHEVLVAILPQTVRNETKATPIQEFSLPFKCFNTKDCVKKLAATLDNLE